MLVDDEEDVVLAITAGLERSGFSVDGFTDPKLALQNFVKGKYDLVIIDIRMPEIDGFELYDKLEQIEQGVKVCFITAFEFNYLALKEIYPSLKLGSFIKKPIEPDELLNRVKQELGR